MNEALRDSFLETAQSWLCAGYHLDIRYLCVRDGDAEYLLSGSIGLNPLPPKALVGCHVSAGRIVAGQVQVRADTNILQVLRDACAGRLVAEHAKPTLAPSGALDYYSDNPDPNRPGVDLHLRVTCERELDLTFEELQNIDAQLRRSNPPFDGLADLCSWLGLQNPASFSRQSCIDLRINPPVDLGDELRLEGDKLTLTFKALATLDISKLEVAIRAAPGVGLARYLVGDKIDWQSATGGLKYGVLDYQLKEADVVQTMLSFGPRTVRRHVLVDRTRARTLRLAAVMALDPGLSALSHSLRSSTRDRDAARFEKAVATLLFLYGFIPSPQTDTDAPDLLVGTPGGRLALVECTLKLGDVNGKVSKLAARRNRLVSELRARGHASDVHAVLVCASPKGEIVGLDPIQLANHSVTLVAREILEAAIEGVQSPSDPDDLLIRASAALVETQRGASPV